MDAPTHEPLELEPPPVLAGEGEDQAKWAANIQPTIERLEVGAKT